MRDNIKQDCMGQVVADMKALINMVKQDDLREHLIKNNNEIIRRYGAMYDGYTKETCFFNGKREKIDKIIELLQELKNYERKNKING